MKKYSEDYRRQLDNKIFAYTDQLKQDKSVDDKGLEKLVNNAITLSEYCIDRLKLKKTQNVADVYRFVHCEYYFEIIKTMHLINEELKKQNQVATKWKFEDLSRDCCEKYFFYFFKDYLEG